MIKITLVLIALLSGKYKIPFLNYIAKQTTKINKELRFSTGRAAGGPSTIRWRN